MTEKTIAGRLRHRYASCDGKQRFESGLLAAQVVRRRNRAKDNGVSKAYYCTFCGAYHIGTTRAPNSRAERHRDGKARLAQHGEEDG